jgi:hypothetical protein
VWPVTWRAGRRRGNGGDARGGFGPDQQDRAGGVIDDEPRGLAEALGSEPGPVAVPGQDEQVFAGRRGHRFPFEVPVALEPVARAAASAGGAEQLAG